MLAAMAPKKSENGVASKEKRMKAARKSAKMALQQSAGEISAASA